MEAEREFAIEMSGRVLAIETLIIRMMARMTDPNRLLDEVETILDKAHADGLNGTHPQNRDVFLQMMRAAGAALQKMRSGSQP